MARNADLVGKALEGGRHSGNGAAHPFVGIFRPFLEHGTAALFDNLDVEPVLGDLDDQVVGNLGDVGQGLPRLADAGGGTVEHLGIGGGEIEGGVFFGCIAFAHIARSRIGRCVIFNAHAGDAVGFNARCQRALIVHGATGHGAAGT